MKFSRANSSLKMWRFSDVSGTKSIPIFRVLTTTFHWVVSPRKIEDLQQQILSEDARCCLGYDSVSLGGQLPNERSACILTAPDITKIHSCGNLLMLEEIGCKCCWKVGTHAPHNAVTCPTQEMNPQKQRCPNLTRTENYPHSDVNQRFQRM
jgi:hypothetical protein